VCGCGFELPFRLSLTRKSLLTSTCVCPHTVGVISRLDSNSEFGDMLMRNQIIVLFFLSVLFVLLKTMRFKVKASDTRGLIDWCSPVPRAADS